VNRRIAIRLVAAFLVAYVGTYTVLSALGREADRLAISGQLRIFPFASPDCVVWQPLGLSVGYRRGKGASRIFTPLIAIDHRFWHRPKMIFE
jgi:hypothetical protein